MVFGRAFFSCGEFLPLGDKRKGLAGESTKGNFEIKKRYSPYFEEKELEVTTFRQCVTIGRQN
jgi:hypothetical protein